MDSIFLSRRPCRTFQSFIPRLTQMTESESSHSNLEPKPNVPATDAEATPAVAEPPAPEPEPWTPERVSEWNAYYDMYVVIGVLLLVFVASANKITHSAIWTHLKTGELIAAKSAPVLRDPFSYTESGHRWVNIPWLFEW